FPPACGCRPGTCRSGCGRPGRWIQGCICLPRGSPSCFLYGIVAENSITYTYILCKPPSGFPPGGAGKGHPGCLGPHRIAWPAPNPPGKNCGKICPEQLTKRKSCAKLLLA